MSDGEHQTEAGQPFSANCNFHFAFSEVAVLMRTTVLHIVSDHFTTTMSPEKFFSDVSSSELVSVFISFHDLSKNPNCCKRVHIP